MFFSKNDLKAFFSFSELSMNKAFSKSYIIPLIEFKLDYFVFTYCLLETTCFTNAEDNFIRITSVRGRRLIAPNITA